MATEVLRKLGDLGLLTLIQHPDPFSGILTILTHFDHFDFGDNYSRDSKGWPPLELFNQRR
jgi:hypothetical protein